MGLKSRTKIVIETSRTIVCANRYERYTGWCASCDTGVELVTALEATSITSVSSYTIQGQAENGEIHSQLTPEGVLLVCLNSLSI